MKLKSIAVAALVAVTALSSQAADIDWGTHSNPLEIDSNLSFTSGAFFDTYSFTLSGSYDVTSGAKTTYGNLIGAAYSLYSYGVDGLIGTSDDVGLGAWTFNSTNTTNTVTLGAGKYFYAVSGGHVGPAAYALSSAIVPVPEPETYAMLAAGLGIVGFVASRRRRND